MARAFENVQPPVHAEVEHEKSMTASVWPVVSWASVPLGDSLSAVPPQKPKASFVPSAENFGVTASMSFGQLGTIFAVPGIEGSYSLEGDGGVRKFLSPVPEPP